MSRVAVGAMVAALCAAPAMAAMTEIDTNGDSLATYEEMLVVYPDLAENVFFEFDTSGDGFLDETEMTAALDAGGLNPGDE